MQRDLTNLLTLRNLVKRDPSAYADEVRQHHAHFVDTVELLDVSPNQSGALAKPLSELIEFLSHVAPLFPKECAAFPEKLLGMLADGRDERMNAPLRLKLVQAAVLLQNRGALSRLRLLPTLFRLFRLQDKALRQLVFGHVVQDARRLAIKHPNGKEGRTVQQYVLASLRDENRTVAKRGLQVLVDLWRRRVWRDERTVNAVAEACFSADTPVLVTALRFFIGLEDVRDENVDSDDEDRVGDMQARVRSLEVEGTRALRKRKRKLVRAKRALRSASRAESRAFNEEEDEAWEEDVTEGASGSTLMLGREAIELVYDPQQFVERLFSKLRRSGEAFDVRMLMMNVISRFVGVHRLLLLNFYPFLQRYMQAHQANVTQILSFLAQACHPLVPPEAVEPCVMTLANHFVTDRSSPEVMSVGLNAVREVCARCPLAMTEELLQDLVQYRKSKNKSVMMASRSLLALFREVRPELLHRRDRGRDGAMRVSADRKAAAAAAREDGGDEEMASGDEEAAAAAAAEAEAEAETRMLYGDSHVPTELPGMDLLVAAERSGEENDDDDEEDADGDADGDAAEGGEAGKAEAAAPAGSSLPLAATRLLTDEDFRKIRRRARDERQESGKKRQREDGSTLRSRMADEVNAEDLVGFQKRQKLLREERLAIVAENREGRGKFGRPKEKGGGTTNKEKLKNQPFMLVKQSRHIKDKTNTKFAIKQRKQSEHIKSLRSMSKKTKRKLKRRRK